MALKKKKQDYTLRILINTFDEHAEEFEKSKKENPSIKQDDFNLPRALCVIACEIEKLKTLHEKF